MNPINLFDDLIWPACAGNVAWAFFSLALDQNNLSDSDVDARLMVLFLLAIYLTVNWMRKYDGPKTGYYWVADACHIITIVVLAIATASPHISVNWLSWSLVALFFVSVIAHFTGAWAGQKYHRYKLAGVNGSGLIAIPVLNWLWPKLVPWHLPISLALVLLLWAYVRWPEIIKLFRNE
ncbi:MAG: hypothetical protein MN733_13280 [Nitrososphaera sp.]|nr:hypothetical protein [Nitrososphaera sp.]